MRPSLCVAGVRWAEMGVLKTALLSRTVLVALMVLSRALCRPYDTSASLHAPCLNSSGSLAIHQPVYPRLARFLEEAVVWDGVYYVRIAQCGYEYEQTHAFLPLLPFLIRLFAFTVFRRLIPIVGLRATLSLAGHAISNGAFVLAALYFHRLSKHVLQDHNLAERATVLFCINPASVFYSSIYSESVFSLLSFAGLWHLVSGAKVAAVLLLALSSAVRSNGILHAGFFLFEAIQLSIFYWKQRRYLLALKVVPLAVLQVLCVIAPFVAFQAYGFFQLCGSSGGAKLRAPRPWCNARVPYLYGFVQDQYWNVGLLRYFQWKQVPNFLLASPMLLLAACSVATYSVRQKRLFWSIGLAATHQELCKSSLSSSRQSETVVPGCREERGESCELRHGDGSKREPGFFSVPVLCFLYQLAFMSAFVTLIMHVQVATRFLSVSPPIYWYSAAQDSRLPKGRRLFWTVFLGYFVVGTLLFSNFYPFT